MSKYNLTDIFEQYQMGSGFTRDFDYEGMLNAGLKIDTDTSIEVMKKISDDFEDVNYHRENNYLQGAIDALEAGDVFEANGKLNDFRHEIKKTMATFDMDMSDDLGAYMASKMDLDEGDAVDLAIEASQEKAGIKENENRYNVVDKSSGEIIDDDLPKQLALKLAAKKKGWVTKKSNKDKMNEVRIDRDVAERIEGLLNIQLKSKFLNYFEELIYDLLDDEPFYVDDVIAHLSNEMHKRINGNQVAGDRLAGIGESSDEYVDEIGEGAMQPGEADLEAGVKGNMDAFNEGKKVDFIRALKVDANGTSMEIESYLRSLKKAGDEFDTVEDYVEDFKNYVADKALQEHFGRFMKDYQ